jgi:prepilin-type N-terminal cleavage/methylation domain-containing protein
MDGVTEMTRFLRDTRGFTLAELLVAVAILGFIVGAIFTIQQQGTFAYLTGAARVEVQQNARLALDTMISDIRSAQPVVNTTQVITSIDTNCATGTPPSSGGGTSIGFSDQNGNTVTYQLSGTDLQKTLSGTTTVLIGGVKTLQIWCYNNASPPVLSSTMANIREIVIQIKTQTERGAQSGSAGDQHAIVEGRVRFRNI